MQHHVFKMFKILTRGKIVFQTSIHALCILNRNMKTERWVLMRSKASCHFS